jgi:hypothetical protein
MPMPRPSFARLFAGGCLAALVTSTSAADPDGAPYPPEARDCVVVEGTSIKAPFWTPLSPAIHSIFGDIGLEGTKELAQALVDRQVAAVPKFIDVKIRRPKVPLPPLEAGLLEAARCAKVVKLALVSGKDDGGKYFGYDVEVLRVVRREAAEGQPSFALVSDFVQAYHHHPDPGGSGPGNFLPADLIAHIADDLVTSGTLPGVHAPEAYGVTRAASAPT